MSNPAIGIEIHGTIYHNDWETGTPVDLDAFLDAFLELVEQHNYMFGGVTRPIDEQGNLGFRMGDHE